MPTDTTNNGPHGAGNIEDRFPELNLSNYDADDVAALNSWGVEAASELTRLRARVEVLERENEKQQREFEREDRSHRDTIDERELAEIARQFHIRTADL